jgi:hypothetical protein
MVRPLDAQRDGAQGATTGIPIATGISTLKNDAG